MHTFPIEAVFGLWRARSLFGHAPICEVLGNRAAQTVILFDKYFPNLKTARDALAHDDERVLGIVKGRQLATELGEGQMIGNLGTMLRCKNEFLEDVEFNYPSRSFRLLLSEIEELLNAH